MIDLSQILPLEWAKNQTSASSVFVDPKNDIEKVDISTKIYMHQH